MRVLRDDSFCGTCLGRVSQGRSLRPGVAQLRSGSALRSARQNSSLGIHARSGPNKPCGTLPSHPQKPTRTLFI